MSRAACGIGGDRVSVRRMGRHPPPGGRVAGHPSWKSRLAWAGRPFRLRRPPQARRLDRADARSSSCVATRSRQPRRTSEGASTARSFGMLSTFPPTACGIATFAAALSAGLVAHGATVDVVRCGAAPALEDPLVVAALGDGIAEPRRLRRIDVLNAHRRRDRAARVRASTTAPTATRCSASDGRDHRADRADRSHRRQRPVGRASDRCSNVRAHVADVVVVMTDTARARLLDGIRRRRRQGDRDPSRRGHAARSTNRGRIDLDRAMIGHAEAPAASAHVGAARSGQGHRVGDRRLRRRSTTSTPRRPT